MPALGDHATFGATTCTGGQLTLTDSPFSPDVTEVFSAGSSERRKPARLARKCDVTGSGERCR